MSHGLSGADADWKGCPSQPQLPMLPASPLRWQDQTHALTSAPAHIQAIHPRTQPHACPYIQTAYLNSQSQFHIPGILTLTKTLHVHNQDGSAVKSSCCQAW